MFWYTLRQLILGNNYALSRLAQQLIPISAKRIGVDAKQLKNRHGGIRALKDNTVNAHIQLDIKGRFYIYVNTGFISYVFSMLHLYCSRIALESQRSSSPLGTPSPDLARLARFCIHRYLGQPKWFGGDASSIKLDHIQLKFFDEVFQDVQCYAIAHELGHLVATTNKYSDRMQRTKCLKYAEEAFSGLIDATAVEKDASYETFAQSVKQSWAEELEADLIGMEMLMELHGSQERISLSCIAVLIYLVLGYTADVYREEVLKTTTPFSPTHPPNVVRLGVLYDDIIQRHSTYLDDQFYRHFFSWTENIVSTAKTDGLVLLCAPDTKLRQRSTWQWREN